MITTSDPVMADLARHLREQDRLTFESDAIDEIYSETIHEPNDLWNALGDMSRDEERELSMRLSLFMTAKSEDRSTRADDLRGVIERIVRRQAAEQHGAKERVAAEDAAISRWEESQY